MGHTHCAAAAALVVVVAAQAQTAAADHAAHHPARPPSAPAAGASAPTSPLAEGEVRRIDRQQQTLTLRHGHIASLDMPPMTMVFRIADAQLLAGLSVGDQVRFAVRQVDAALVVTAIEKAPR